MNKPAIQYKPTSALFFQESDRTQNLRVRIEPQSHEMIMRPDEIYRLGQTVGGDNERAMVLGMIDLLRGQALVAYDTVMASGLAALAGRPMQASEVEDAMGHYMEIAVRHSETLEKRLAEAEKLAADRLSEIKTLERVLRPERN